MVYFNNKA